MARGGRRSGAGRKKGSPNKTTAEIRELAREHTLEALEALVEIANDGESEAARVSAANAILDRGFGRPAQPVLMRSLDSMTEQEIIELLGYNPSTEELSALASTLPAGTA